MIELSAFYMIFCKTAYKAIDALAGFASKYLNTIYIVQWLLIGWTGIFSGGNAFKPVIAIPLGFAYIAMAFTITKIYIRIKKDAIHKK